MVLFKTLQSSARQYLTKNWEFYADNMHIFLFSGAHQAAELLKLLEVRRGQEGDDDFIECNNMTLINLVLKLLGPTHERTLTIIMLMIQVVDRDHCT